MNYAVVALQNTGEEYEYTRHNAGAVALSAYLDSLRVDATYDRSYLGYTAQIEKEGTDIMLVFPKQYMNESGKTVSKVLKSVQSPEKLLVIYDDIDLPIGTYKLSYNRGSGGHNGINSIVNEAGTSEFLRLRVGIAPKDADGNMRKPEKGDPVVRFVLGKAHKYELESYRAIGKQLDRILSIWVTKGVHAVLSEYK
jgi:peptidyl-tRNA hydrolase, PTH1 family